MMIDYETTHCRIHQVILAGNQIAAVLTETLDPNTACPVTRFIAIDISSSGTYVVFTNPFGDACSLNEFERLSILGAKTTHAQKESERERVKAVVSGNYLELKIACQINLMLNILHSFSITFVSFDILSTCHE